MRASAATFDAWAASLMPRPAPHSTMAAAAAQAAPELSIPMRDALRALLLRGPHRRYVRGYLPTVAKTRDGDKPRAAALEPLHVEALLPLGLAWVAPRAPEIVRITHAGRAFLMAPAALRR